MTDVDAGSRSGGNRLARLSDFFLRLTSHAAFGGVVTLLVVLAGAAASLFTDGIRKQWSIFPSPDSTLGGTIFWILVALSVVLIVVNQRSLLLRDEQSQEKLSDSIKRLEQSQGSLSGSIGQLDNAVKRLNTLPSEGFLASFQDAYYESFRLATNVVIDESSTVAQIEHAIRNVLFAIADVAKDFDGARKDTVYSANIMLYRELGAPPFDPMARDLIPVPNGSKEYSGLLEAVASLSASTNNGGPGVVDRSLTPITLPVPVDASSCFDHQLCVSKTPVIPGAPASFVTGQFQSFCDIESFVSHLRNETTLDLRYIETIRKYFTEGDGKGIKSFASMPIVTLVESEDAPPLDEVDTTAVDGVAKTGISGQDGVSREDAATLDAGKVSSEGMLGVLNLHSQERGLLADNGNVLFAPLMGPFTCLLALLLLTLKGAKESESKKCSSASMEGIE